MMKNKCKKIAKQAIKILSSKRVLYMVFVLFVIQSIFFAVTVRTGIPPDENFHLGVINFFTEESLDPIINEQVTGFQFGDILRAPDTLYHYVMSLIVRVFGLEGRSLVVTLRILSVATATAGLAVFVKTASKLQMPKYVSNLTVFLMSQTLMFSFLAGSVSYDNAQFLVATSSFYVLVNIAQKKNSYVGADLLVLAILLLVGGLLKVTFLPLAFLLVLLLVAILYQKRTEGLVYTHSATSRSVTVVMLVLLFLFGALAVERYGMNVVRYRDLDPPCAKVHSVEQCSESVLIETYRNLRAMQSANPRNLNPIDSFAFDWARETHSRMLGIFAHRTIEPVSLVRLLSFIALCFGIIFAIAARKRHRLLDGLLLLSAVFIGVLLVKNYTGAYTGTGIFGTAIQGRYIFPILPVVYLGLLYYSLQAVKEEVYKVALIVSIAIIMFMSALPTYIHKADCNWYENSIRLLCK